MDAAPTANIRGVASHYLRSDAPEGNRVPPVAGMAGRETAPDDDDVAEATNPHIPARGLPAAPAVRVLPRIRYLRYGVQALPDERDYGPSVHLSPRRQGLGDCHAIGILEISANGQAARNTRDACARTGQLALHIQCGRLAFE